MGTGSEKRQFGDIGEEIACRFLEKRGFRVIDRNYLKKWGELDVVAKKDKVIHFVEVKTGTWDAYRPEENVHAEKLARLRRAIQTWLLDHNTPLESDHQIDVVTVRLDLDTKKAKVAIIERVA